MFQDNRHDRETMARTMILTRCAALGAGDLSDDRLARAIIQAVEVFQLSRRPEPAEVFSRAVLPPAAQRGLRPAA